MTKRCKMEERERNTGSSAKEEKKRKFGGRKRVATKDNREENREETHMIKEDTARGKERNYRIEDRSTL